MNRQQRRHERGTRLPNKPMTHRMDTLALQQAYRLEGLVRPELIAQKSPTTGDKNYEGKIQPSTKEEIHMEHTQQNTDTLEIPAVAKKQEASKIRLVNGPSLGARAIERTVDSAIVGTFAVGVGAALMALSKVLLAGPAAGKPVSK